MAKSARASSRKANNQKLKKNVFGPVELARTERLSRKFADIIEGKMPEGAGQFVVSHNRAMFFPSARLGDKPMEDVKLLPQPPSPEAEEAEANEDAMQSDITPSNQLKEEEAAMEVDLEKTGSKALGKKRISKRKPKKSAIVFRKYKDSTSKRRR